MVNVGANIPTLNGLAEQLVHATREFSAPNHTLRRGKMIPDGYTVANPTVQGDEHQIAAIGDPIPRNIKPQLYDKSRLLGDYFVKVSR